MRANLSEPVYDIIHDYAAMNPIFPLPGGPSNVGNWHPRWKKNPEAIKRIGHLLCQHDRGKKRAAFDELQVWLTKFSSSIFIAEGQQVTVGNRFVPPAMLSTEGRFYQALNHQNCTTNYLRSGEAEIVAAAVDGVTLNAPNDFVFGPDGQLYFTGSGYRHLAAANASSRGKKVHESQDHHHRRGNGHITRRISIRTCRSPRSRSLKLAWNRSRQALRSPISMSVIPRPDGPVWNSRSIGKWCSGSRRPAPG